MNKRNKYANEDFTILDLPKNRIQSTIDIVKNRFFILILSGLIFILFTIPMLIIVFLRNYQFFLTTKMFNEGIIDKVTYYQETFKIVNLSNLFFFIVSFIFSIGISGLLEIFKNLVFQEPVFIKFDFIKGVKNNYKIVSLTISVLTVINLFLQFNLRIEPITTISNIIFIVSLIIFILYLPISIINIFQVSLYNLSFKNYMKNSFIFFGKKPYILLLIIFLLGIFYLISLLKGIIFYFVFILYIIFVLPILFLILNQIMFYIFDLYINKNNYPEIYRKGIN